MPQLLATRQQHPICGLTKTLELCSKVAYPALEYSMQDTDLARFYWETGQLSRARVSCRRPTQTLPTDLDGRLVKCSRLITLLVPWTTGQMWLEVRGTDERFRFPSDKLV